MGSYHYLIEVLNHSTEAGISGTVDANGNVAVTATDSVSGSVSLDSTSVGIFTGDESTAKAKVNNQKANAWVGEGASVRARYDISVLAKTVTNMSAQADVSAGGLVANGKATTEVSVTRASTVTVGKNATIESRYGNVSILGTSDTTKLNASTTMGGGGVYSGGAGPVAKATLVTNTDVSVLDGAKITAVFGDLLVSALSFSDVNAYAYRHMGAFAGNNKSKTVISVAETLKITIGGSGAQAYLLGKDTSIITQLTQNVYGYATSYTGAADSETFAESVIDVKDDLDIVVNNAYIGGIDTLLIEASAPNLKVWARTYSEIVGFTGDVFATSTIRGSATADIRLNDGSVLAGENITVSADAPDIKNETVINRDATAAANTVMGYVTRVVDTFNAAVAKALRKIPFIGKALAKAYEAVTRWVTKTFLEPLSSDATMVEDGKMTNSGTVYVKSEVHLGGGTNTYVDIDEFDTVHYVGLDKDFSSASQVAAIANGIITVHKLYNNDVGTLTILASTSDPTGSIRVYDNRYLPNVVIRNWSENDLHVGVVELIYGVQPRPTLDIGEHVAVEKYYYEIPQLTVEVKTDANVHFTKNLDCGDGIITIVMNGGSVNTDGSIALYANKLYITGAGSVGTDVNHRFNAYILDIEKIDESTYQAAIAKRPPMVEIEATGNVFAYLTHVVVGNADAEGNVIYNGTPNLYLEKIVAGNGEADILLGVPQQIVYEKVEGESAGSTIAPGNSTNFGDLDAGVSGDTVIKDADGNDTEYTVTADGTIKYKDAVTIDLSKYLVVEANEYIPYNYYYLPTGVMLLTDKNGKIVSISENGDLGDTNATTGSGYDLQNVKFTTENGKIKEIAFLKEGTDEIIQKLVIGADGSQTYIGSDGATLYFEPADTHLGIVLPDGTKIFWSNAFVQDTEEGSKVLTPWVIYDENGKPLYVLEPMRDANGNVKKGSYHVISYKADGTTFDEGYIYDLELVQSGTVEEITVQQTPEEAQNVIGKLFGSINVKVNQLLNAADERIIVDTLADQIAEYFANELTDGWEVDVTVTFYMLVKQIAAEEPDGSDNLGSQAEEGQEDEGTEGGNPEGEAGNQPTYVNKVFLEHVGVMVELVGLGYSKANMFAVAQEKELTKYDDIEKFHQYVMNGTTYYYDNGVSQMAGTKDQVPAEGVVLDNGDKVVVTTKDGKQTIQYCSSISLYGTQYHAESNYFTIDVPRYSPHYNTLKDLMLFYNSDTKLLEVLKLNRIGSGKTTENNFGGGYLKDDSHIIFIDKDAQGKWSTDAYTEGRILYVTDPVAVPAGKAPMILSIRYADSSNDVSNATLVFAPGMELIGYKDGLPIYSANVQKRDGNGNFYYADPNGNEYTSTTAWNAPAGAERDALVEWMKTNNLVPVYEKLPGMVVIQPSGNGYNVSYQEEGIVTTPVDIHGFAIVSETVRINLDANNGVPVGAVLYMELVNGKYEATGVYYTVDGHTVFRKYEQGTFLGHDAPVFVEYTETYAYATGGTQLQAHKATDNVFMAPVETDSSVITYNARMLMAGIRAQALSTNHFHFDADYFYKNAQNQLVKLVKGELFSYTNDSNMLSGIGNTFDEGVTFTPGSVGVTFYGDNGEPVLHFLECGDRIIMIEANGDWSDNFGERGKLSGGAVRDLQSFSGNTFIEINYLEGDSISLQIAGANTSITDNGDEQVNIKTNDLIIKTDSGSIFTEDNPLVLKPMDADVVNIRFMDNTTGDPYTGKAYITTKLESETQTGDIRLNVHDSIIGAAGKVVLDILKGNVQLKDLTVLEGGEFTATTKDGDAQISGKLDVAGKTTITVSGAVTGDEEVNASGDLTVQAGTGIKLHKLNVSGTANLNTDAGDIYADTADVSGKATITTDDGKLIVKDELSVAPSGDVDADVTEGAEIGKLDVQGKLSLNSAGTGDFNAKDTDVSGNLDVDIADGDINLDNLDVSGTVTLDAPKGKLNVPGDITVAAGGKLTAGVEKGASLGKLTTAGEFKLNSTGNGDVTVDSAAVTGDLSVTTATGHIILGNTTVNGILNLTTANGDLLMKDADTGFVFGADWNESASAWNIGGNIGAADRYIHVNILPDATGAIQALNITNAADLYLVQDTDIATDDSSLPHNGRLEDAESKTDHDDAISDLDQYDETIVITVPTQSAEELAKQLASGRLSDEELWTLINAKLQGTEVKQLLQITDEAVEAAIAALAPMTDDELKQLVAQLQLKAADDSALTLSDKKDMAALTPVSTAGKTTEDLQAMAAELGISADPQATDDELRSAIEAKQAQQRADLRTELKTVLGLTDEELAAMNDQQLAEAYEAAYAAEAEQYRKDVTDAYRYSIEVKLESTNRLTQEEINYLLQQDLTREEAVVVTLLTAAIAAKDDTDTVIMDDETELFPAYWKSLTDAQKKELVELAWTAAGYPAPEDEAEAPRELVVNIVSSTGAAYLLNTGDITVTQQTGTFTAGEVVSTYGKVTVTAPEIQGAANKQTVTDNRVLQTYADQHVDPAKANGANIYAEGMDLKATTGGIGDKVQLVTEQILWKEATVGNIDGEDAPPASYSATNTGSWAVVRNALTGAIEMKFVMDYTAVRDLDLISGSDFSASAPGSIAIRELTGNMQADSVTSTSGNVSLEAEADLNVAHITAHKDVNLTAGGSILDAREANDTAANVVAGGNSTMNAVSGSIGADEEHPLEVSVAGILTAESAEGVDLHTTDKLDLVADSNGQLNVVSDKKLNISSKNKDLVIGAVKSTTAEVIITAAGAVIAGNRGNAAAHVAGTTVSITALNGGIGAAETLLVDTAEDGKLNLNADGGDVQVKEISGQLTLGQVNVKNGDLCVTGAKGITVGTVKASNDVTLITENGSITALDAADSIREAAQAAQDLAVAKAKVNALNDQIAVLDRYIDSMNDQKAALQAARDAVDTAQQAKADAEADVESAQTALQSAQQAKADAETVKSDAAKAAEQAQAELDALLGDPNADPAEITSKEAALQQAQADLQQAETDLQQANATLQQAADQLQTANDTLKQTSKDLTDAQNRIPGVLKQANEKTLGLVEGLDAATTVDEAIAALDTELADREADRSDLADELALANTDVNAKQLVADSTAAAAQSNGITAEGDVQLNLNADSGKANVGQSDNALGITAEGKISIAAGDGTELGLIALESGNDLTFGDVAASDSITASAVGNITGTAPIVSGNATIQSLMGNVGSADAPLEVSVDMLNASANGVYIRNLKSLVLDTVTGKDVNLDVQGDLSDSDNGNGIVAGDLSIRADGSVGTSENPLDMEVDGLLNLKAGSTNLNTQSNLTVDRIETTGNTTITSHGDVMDADGDSRIVAGSLDITAFGNIGSDANPLDICVPGSIRMNNVYGKSVYRDHYQSAVQPDGYPDGYPNGGAPKTGDHSSIALWLLLMVFSAAAVLFLEQRRRKFAGK